MENATSISSDITNTKSELRNLRQTQQEWYPDKDGAYLIFNTPEHTGKLLDAQQGKNPKHRGTCGIVSCVNVLRLAGRLDTTEEEVLSYALDHRLCRIDSTPEHSGGTCYGRRKKILRGFGLETEYLQPSIDTIAECVSAGKGVIISVHADEFWQDAKYRNYLHAVTVTSVVKDAAGTVTGFYICDSGSGNNDYAHYYTAEHIRRALALRFMNVTTSIIR